MSSSPAVLAAIFRARQGGSGAADLGARLERALAEARTRWPGIPVDSERFVGHLADKMTGEGDIAAALEVWCVPDLYLAFACAEGLPEGLSIFDREILAHVGKFVARFRRGPEFGDEIRQILRERLLLATADRAGRIADYGGRGLLVSWVRVAAARAAIDRVRHEATEPTGHEDLHDLALAGDLTDPEIAAIRARLGATLQAALESALDALTAKQRTLLRMHYVDAFTLDQMATAYRAHRATIAKWLRAARDEIVEQTREHAVARLALPAGEVTSLLRLLHSQLHISLGTFFAHRKARGLP